MFCRLVLSTTKLFKKPLVSNISTLRIRTISTLLIDNIVVENHHLIVEANTQMIVEATIIRMIDEANFEMNFEIDQTIDISQIVVSKNALYVRNLIVDQLIIRKTSATTRKSAFSIDILNLGIIIVFVSTF